MSSHRTGAPEALQDAPRTTDGPLEGPSVEIPEAVRRYIEIMDSVPGWFFEIDATVFTAVASIQPQLGIKGDLLEIGVFRGKSAILMGYLADKDSHLVVCDLFGADVDLGEENASEKATHYPGFDQEVFEQEYLRFHPELPDVIAAPSTTLDRPDLAGGYRLVHVDGGHSYPVVSKDIQIVRKLLAPGGVAVFDDWANPENPGVAVALWEEFHRGEMIPLCLTSFKMYATWGPGALTTAALDAWAEAEPTVELSYPHEIGSHRVRRYSMRPPIGPDLASARAEPPNPPPIAPAAPEDPSLGQRLKAVGRQVSPPLLLSAYRRLRRLVRPATTSG